MLDLDLPRQLPLAPARQRWRSVAGELFPAAAPAGVRPWIAAIAVLAGTAALLGRQVGAVRTLWAEDGTVFLSQAERMSFLDAVRHPYAGYLHAVPRVLAEIAMLLPMRAAPVVLAVEASLVVALVALFVYVASAGHLPAPGPRLVLALGVVLVPVAQVDVLGNIANLHWFLMYAAFWGLLWNPQRRSQAVLAAAVVALSVLSDPLTLLFLPVAAARLVSTRFLRANAAGLTLVVAGAVQLVGAALGHAHRDTHISSSLLRPVGWWFAAVLDGSLLGTRWAPDPVSRRNAALALAAVVVVVVVVVVRLAYRRIDQPALLLAVLCLLASFVCYLLPVWIGDLATPRYAVLPVLLLVTALVVVVSPLLMPGEPRRAVIALALVGVAASWLANYHVASARDHGASWSAALVDAQRRCAAAPGTDIRVPIAPQGWTVALSCRDVTGGQSR